MIEPRLTSEFQISALRRIIEADGGFLTILRRGDATAGAILLIGQIRGQDPILFDRYPNLDGGSEWQAVTAQIPENEAEVFGYWQKRTARDPDLWVIELDVASTERLNEITGTFY